MYATIAKSGPREVYPKSIYAKPVVNPVYETFIVGPVKDNSENSE